MDRGRQLAAVLEPLYAAALQPERMAEFSAALCAATGSHTGAVMVHDGGHGRGRLDLLFGADPAEAALYEAEYAADNLWMLRAQHRMVAGGYMDSDAVATRAELKRTRYYNEYLRRGDVEQSLALCAKADAEGVVVATLCRSGRLTPYTADHLALVRRVAPHWANAYAIQRRLSHLQQVETLEAAVEVAPLAMVMLDGALRVRRMNPAAEQVFAQGRWLRLNQGRPEAVVEGVPLRQALELAVRGHCIDGRQIRQAASVVVKDAVGSGAAIAAVHPLAVADDRGHAAVLFLQSTDSGRNMGVDLRHLFGLTVAEATFACALYRHADIGLAAQACGIALSTAQTRIKLIYDKTTERGLPALMRLLAAVAQVSG